MEGREGKKESAPSRVLLVDVWLCGRQEPSNSAACIEQVGVYRLPVQAVPRQPLAVAGLACRLSTTCNALSSASLAAGAGVARRRRATGSPLFVSGAS